MRQTSAEAERIFNLIMTLYKECDGDWQKLVTDNGLEESDVEAFLDYAACFLSNVGNYYVSSQAKKTDRSILTHIQGIR
jgi:dipeptidyl-peptidase-3